MEKKEVREFEDRKMLVTLAKQLVLSSLDATYINMLAEYKLKYYPSLYDFFSTVKKQVCSELKAEEDNFSWEDFANNLSRDVGKEFSQYIIDHALYRRALEPYDSKRPYILQRDGYLDYNICTIPEKGHTLVLSICGSILFVNDFYALGCRTADVCVTVKDHYTVDMNLGIPLNLEEHAKAIVHVKEELSKHMNLFNVDIELFNMYISLKKEE